MWEVKGSFLALLYSDDNLPHDLEFLPIDEASFGADESHVAVFRRNQITAQQGQGVSLRLTDVAAGASGIGFATIADIIIFVNLVEGCDRVRGMSDSLTGALAERTTSLSFDDLPHQVR